MRGTKKDILAACSIGFMQHGIRRMSCEKLATQIGISTKTIYKYFKNKETLLDEVLSLFHEQRLEMMVTLSFGRNPVSFLFDFCRFEIESKSKVNKLFYRDLNSYYPNLADKVELSMSKNVSDALIQILEQGIRENLFRDEINPTLALEGLYILNIPLKSLKHYQNLPALPAHDKLLNIVAIYIRGLCTNVGTNTLDKHISELKTSKAIGFSVL